MGLAFGVTRIPQPVMGDVEVSVRIIYDGQKKRIINDTNFQIAIDTLMSDLLRLKIPHPKVENISIVYTGCVQFNWRTQMNGTLHRQLVQKVNKPNREVTNELHIETITLYERKVPQSVINGTSPSSKLRSRPKPSVYESMDDIRRSPSYGADTCDSSDSGIKSIRMKEEAQKILDSFMHGQTGSVPASTKPGPSSFRGSSPPRGPRPYSSPLGNLPSPARTPRSSFSLPVLTPTLLPVTPSAPTTPTFSASISALHTPVRPAFSASVNHLPQPPHLSNPSTSFNANYSVQPPSFLPKKPVGAISRNGVLPPPSPPPPPAFYRPPFRNPGLPYNNSPPLHLGITAPLPNDKPAINQLTRELWDTRRQITALAAQEVGILGQLRALNAPPQTAAQSTAYGDSATRKRIEQVETELQSERRKRAEAEQLVRDVEKECREPFVVPALLDAFAAISRLSGEALM